MLHIAQERFAGLGLGTMVALNTYTTGNGFVAACRQLGIRYSRGFCAPTVIEDGGWSIQGVIRFPIISSSTFFWMASAWERSPVPRPTRTSVPPCFG